MSEDTFKLIDDSGYPNLSDFNDEEKFKQLNDDKFQIFVDDPTEMLYPWRIFLASLSAAELLLLTIYIPLEIWKMLGPNIAKGGAICKITEYIRMLTACASVLNLAAVSIERYIVVVHPIKSKFLCTNVKCILSVIFVWILSSILSLPVLLITDVYSLIYSNNVTEVEVFMCTEDKESGSDPPWTGRIVSLYQLLVLLVIPLLLSTWCYQATIRVLWKSMGAQALGEAKEAETIEMETEFIQKEERPRLYSRLQHFARLNLNKPVSGTDNDVGVGQDETPQAGGVRIIENGGHIRRGINYIGKSRKEVRPRHCRCNQGWIAAQKINNGRKNVIKMMILILVMYLLCWGIWMTSKLIMWWAGNTSMRFGPSYYRFSMIAKHLPALHSIINPIIYSLMSGNFRKHICKKCK